MLIFANITYNSCFAISTTSFQLGVWFFSYKNWIISREMPKLLNKNGVLSDSALSGNYCISLDKLDEKAYDRLNMGAVICILVIQIWNGLMIILMNTSPKNHTIYTIQFIALICCVIPWLLIFCFQGKSVLTIYQTTKKIENLEVNMKMMTLHMVIISVLILTMCV